MTRRFRAVGVGEGVAVGGVPVTVGVGEIVGVMVPLVGVVEVSGASRCEGQRS